MVNLHHAGSGGFAWLFLRRSSAWLGSKLSGRPAAHENTQQPWYSSPVPSQVLGYFEVVEGSLVDPREQRKQALGRVGEGGKERLVQMERWRPAAAVAVAAVVVVVVGGMLHASSHGNSQLAPPFVFFPLILTSIGHTYSPIDSSASSTASSFLCDLF